MRKNHWAAAIGFIVLLAVPAAAWADASLGSSYIASQWGNGADYVGNTADDAWNFWYEDADNPNNFGLLSQYVTSPAYLPSPATTSGWVFATGDPWDARFEGVWGDPTHDAMYMHPWYHGSHNILPMDVAITYKVPTTGLYTIEVSAADENIVAGGGIYDGQTIKLEKTSNPQTGPTEVFGSVLIGDQSGPATASLQYTNVSLTAGEYVRLRVNGNTNWSGDMTQINSFQIYQGAAPPPAPTPEPLGPPPPPTPTPGSAYITYSQMQYDGGGVSASSSYTARYYAGNPANAVNENGLNSDGTHKTTYGSSQQPYWWLTDWGTTTPNVSESVFDNQWYQINLGALYRIDRIDIWNYNLALQYYRMVKTFDLMASADGVNFDMIASSLLLEKSDVMADKAQTFHLIAFDAQYLKFVLKTTHGSYGSAANGGFAEIQVYGDPIPEPATITLLGLGALAALIRRRK